MIGGLQGEFGDLDIKYLKQKNLKMSVANIGKLQENTHALCKMAAKISQQIGQDFRSKRLISQPCKNLPLTWSDFLVMAVTPSFQLQIVHCLKHWIVDFLSFETTYRMHKLNSIKCSKSG